MILEVFSNLNNSMFISSALEEAAQLDGDERDQKAEVIFMFRERKLIQ